MKTFLTLLFSGIALVLVYFLLFWIFMFVIGIICLAVLIFVGAWAFGMPVTITKNGTEIGYLKRAKFYPKR